MSLNRFTTAVRSRRHNGLSAAARAANADLTVSPVTTMTPTSPTNTSSSTEPQAAVQACRKPPMPTPRAPPAAPSSSTPSPRPGRPLARCSKPVDDTSSSTPPSTILTAESEPLDLGPASSRVALSAVTILRLHGPRRRRDDRPRAPRRPSRPARREGPCARGRSRRRGRCPRPRPAVRPPRTRRSRPPGDRPRRRPDPRCLGGGGSLQNRLQPSPGERLACPLTAPSPRESWNRLLWSP